MPYIDYLGLDLECKAWPHSILQTGNTPTASSTDADESFPLKTFHPFPRLHFELRDTVIKLALASASKRNPYDPSTQPVTVSSLASVNKEWNKTATDALFSRLEVYPEDIVDFEDFCSTRTRALSKVALLITSEGKRSMSSDEVALYTQRAVSELFTAVNSFEGPYRNPDGLLRVEIAISGFDEVPLRGLLDSFSDFPDAPDIGSFDIQYRHYISTTRRFQRETQIAWDSKSRPLKPLVPLPLILTRLPSLASLSLDLTLKVSDRLDCMAGKAIGKVHLFQPMRLGRPFRLDSLLRNI